MRTYNYLHLKIPRDEQPRQGPGRRAVPPPRSRATIAMVGLRYRGLWMQAKLPNRARVCIAPASLSSRLLAQLIVDELLGLGLSKLGATPAPERLDFLCRSTFASVFRNTKTCADRILKIHARRQHRLRQNSEAR